MKRRDEERGALVPMLALGLAVVLLVAAVLAGVASEASKRAHAQAAADAVALAGASGGEAEANRMARAYSGEISEFTIDGTTVRVVVLLDGITSLAQAERHLVATGGG